MRCPRRLPRIDRGETVRRVAEHDRSFWRVVDEFGRRSDESGRIERAWAQAVPVAEMRQLSGDPAQG